MNSFNVVLIEDAELDLQRIVDYLRINKQSKQAARNVMDDFIATRKILSTVAGSLKMDNNPKLAERGLKRINFKKHNYFMLFYIKDDKAFVTNIFHGMQDYQNKTK